MSTSTLESLQEFLTASKELLESVNDIQLLIKESQTTNQNSTCDADVCDEESTRPAVQYVPCPNKPIAHSRVPVAKLERHLKRCTASISESLKKPLSSSHQPPPHYTGWRPSSRLTHPPPRSENFYARAPCAITIIYKSHEKELKRTIAHEDEQNPILVEVGLYKLEHLGTNLVYLYDPPSGPLSHADLRKQTPKSTYEEHCRLVNLIQTSIKSAPAKDVKYASDEDTGVVAFEPSSTQPRDSSNIPETNSIGINDDQKAEDMEDDVIQVLQSSSIPLESANMRKTGNDSILKQSTTGVHKSVQEPADVAIAKQERELLNIKDKDKGEGKNGDRSKDRGQRRIRDQDTDQDKNRYREKDRDKDQDRDRNKDRNKDWHKDRDRDRHRVRDRGKHDSQEISGESDKHYDTHRTGYSDRRRSSHHDRDREHRSRSPYRHSRDRSRERHRHDSEEASDQSRDDRDRRRERHHRDSKSTAYRRDISHRRR